MIKPPRSIQAFKQALAKEKISLIIRQNESGIIYGLTYIDHNTKCVFNGSDIGKDYSAKPILEKCGVAQIFTSTQLSAAQKYSEANSIELPDKHKHQSQDLSKIIEGIITPTEQYEHVPFELRTRRKKKRKSNS